MNPYDTDLSSKVKPKATDLLLYPYVYTALGFTVAELPPRRQNPPVLSKRIGERIRNLRESFGGTGLSQEALGERAGGINKETVNRIESGGNTTIETLRRLADALDVAPESLFTVEEPDLSRHGRPVVPDDAIPDGSDVRLGYQADAIPVLAEGEATPDGMHWTNTILQDMVIEYIARPHDLDDPDAYGLVVLGDSMSPTFKKGHRLIASPNTPLEDGDEAYVQLHSGQRLIKTVFKTEGGWRLESINVAYEPLDVTDDLVISIHPIVWAKRKRPGRRVIDEATRRRRG